jgi:hypothetical protein
MSISFGESDKDGSLSFLNLKYKATAGRMDFIIDRDIYNIVGPTFITLNGHKIWHENNDGPNSGLNADLLDGRHAVEFKDRYGYHHFMHMFQKPPTVTDKCFVKVATFTMRKVGTPDDFKSDGTPPYSGIFEFTGNGVGGVTADSVVVPGGTFRKSDIIEGMQIRDAITQFQANTPYALSDYDPDLFHTTNMLTQGIYNGTLRGCVSILKDKHPTTFDFHIGLFENPTAPKEADGWEAIYKYFYVSLHDETLPFLDEDAWTLATNNDPFLNKGVPDLDKAGNPYNVNADTDDINHDRLTGGGVNDGYKSSFPSFPTYNWNDPNKPGYADNTAYVDSIIAGHAMANLYFDKPDKTKAETLKELKREYGNNAQAALKGSLEKIKDLGLAMAKLNDDDELTTAGIKVGDTTGTTTGGTTAPVDDTAAKIQAMKDAISSAKSSYKTAADKAMNDISEDSGTGLDDIQDNDPSKGSDSPAETHNRYQTKVDVQGGNRGSYTTPIMTEQDAHPFKNERRRKAFPDPTKKDQDDSYQQFVDIMRLYHTKSRKDIIDGIPVQTYYFDLYICIDAKSEVRIQPYMSSQCIMYNFQECVQEADLPMTKFIRPKSIYDNRYASVRHRHYDYERRIWENTLEVDQIWKNFDNYVKKAQGIKNAYKVMMTDKNGDVYAGEDNFERHSEPASRRIPERVLVTLSEATRTLEGDIAQACSCIGTSEITTDELFALKDIDTNIQQQFKAIEKSIYDLRKAMDKVWAALDALVDAIAGAMGDFVKKSGDQMTGSLWMKYDGKTYKDDPTGYEKPESFVGVKFFSNASGAKHGGYLYGASSKSHIGLGVERVPGSGAESDWALAVTPEIDSTSKPYAIMLNGTRIQFTKNGRGAGGTPSTFNLDFEKLKDWWHNEIAPTTSYGELDG